MSCIFVMQMTGWFMGGLTRFSTERLIKAKYVYNIREVCLKNVWLSRVNVDSKAA